jgi:hypothetical protein
MTVKAIFVHILKCLLIPVLFAARRSLGIPGHADGVEEHEELNTWNGMKTTTGWN